MTLISTLPDDCIQLIFDFIPTRELFVFRCVCHSWKCHVQLNFLRRKTLILLYGFMPNRIIPESFFIKKFAAHNIDENGNSLNYESFINYNKISLSESKHLKVDFFVKNFPNVRTLIIATDRTRSTLFRSFNELISRYSSQLVTLQMYFCENIKDRNIARQQAVSIFVCDLIEQLNWSSALQHVTFDSPWKMTPPIDAPTFVTRIKQFYFKFPGLSKVMIDWLRQYERAGRLKQLTRINLGRICSSGKSEEILENNQFNYCPVRSTVAFIPYGIHSYKTHKERLSSLIANFSSLTSISFNFECLAFRKSEISLHITAAIVSLSRLAHTLSPLTKLVLLNLKMDNVAILNESLNPTTTPQLESIKALELDFDNLFTNDCSIFAHQLTTFVHILPNLCSIRVITNAQHEYNTNRLTQTARDLLAGLKSAYGRDSLEMSMKTFFKSPFKL